MLFYFSVYTYFFFLVKRKSQMLNLLLKTKEKGFGKIWSENVMRIVILIQITLNLSLNIHSL